MQEKPVRQEHISIPIDSTHLEGTLDMPPGAIGLVVFAHGSGSSRLSPRNAFVARQLSEARIGTLLFDLLTPEEDAVDRQTAELRFDIALLSDRLSKVTEWLIHDGRAQELPVGYFGASTGAAAALKAAAKKPAAVRCVVSRGGRPDLAGDALRHVLAPVLLLVGSKDGEVITLNEDALARLRSSEKEIRIIEGASHLFEEPGKLEEVAGQARDWFKQWFTTGC